METQVSAPPAAQTEVIAPTVETTVTATPKRAPSFDDIKAARMNGTAVAKPAETTTPQTEAKTTAEIDISDTDLNNFTNLTRQNRELRTQQTALEARAAIADKVDAAMKLIAEGKHHAAIAAVLGEDVFDAATMQVLNIKTPEGNPELKALKDELASVKAEQAKTHEQLTTEAKAKAEAERNAGVNKITATVTANPAAFPYLVEKPERITAALKEADIAYDTILKRDKRTDLTPSEKDLLIQAALETAEEEHAAKAKEYGAIPKLRVKPATTTTAAKPASKSFESSMRGSTAPTETKRGPKTFAEIKAARLKASK